MERLTIKSEVFPNEYRIDYSKGGNSLEVSEKAVNKLGAYEDAEEQGLRLKLPCKVGTKVYQIHTLQKTGRKVIAEVEADAFFLALCILEGRFGKLFS